jgi:diguanylate cyclase (GGDEF)-like protein
LLKEVAGLLKKGVRDVDTVVRYGGEEFLIIMTETEEGVEHTVERLRSALGR